MGAECGAEHTFELAELIVLCGVVCAAFSAWFIQMNEKKPTWMCPVCDKPAPYDQLIIDG